MKSTVLVFCLGFTFGVICIGSNNFHYAHGYATNASHRTEYGNNTRNNSSYTNFGLRHNSSTRINRITAGFANNNNTNPSLSYAPRVYPASRSYNNSHVKQRRLRRSPPINKESGDNVNADYDNAEEETSPQDDNPIDPNLIIEPNNSMRQPIPSENPYTYGTLASKQSGANEQFNVDVNSPTGASFPTATQQVPMKAYVQPGSPEPQLSLYGINRPYINPLQYSSAQPVSPAPQPSLYGSHGPYINPLQYSPAQPVSPAPQPSLYGFNGPYINPVQYSAGEQSAHGQISNLRQPQAYTPIPFATRVQPAVNMQVNSYPSAYEQSQPYLAYGPSVTPIQLGFYGQLQATFAYTPFITLAQPGVIGQFNTYPGIYGQPVNPYQLGNNLLNTPPYLMSQVSYPGLSNLKQHPLSANYQSENLIKAPVQSIYQNTGAYYQPVQPETPAAFEEPISLGAKWQQHAPGAFEYQQSGATPAQSDSMEQDENSESASDQPDECDDAPVRLLHITSEVE